MSSFSEHPILFNKPFLPDNGLRNIVNAFISGKKSFAQKCQQFFYEKYNFKNTFFTSSCTGALEMASLLLNLKPGDEVIIPSYTFVSSANPFVLRGATIVFADSSADSPNIEVDRLEALITKKTKAIVVVHYGGIACDMNSIMQLANKHNLIVVEDAAHAIDAYYDNKPLGSFGHLSAFSFHNTKNISSDEGGMLVVNDESLLARAEIIFEKGTNRKAFNRGQVKKYEWMDVGSSFCMSNLTAAYLYSQLEHLDEIQKKRMTLWNLYFQSLQPLQEKKFIQLPELTALSQHNAHLFFIVCKSEDERNLIIVQMAKTNIPVAFHYSSLHNSPFFKPQYKGLPLINTNKFSSCLLRLPLHYYLSESDVMAITRALQSFYLPNTI